MRIAEAAQVLVTSYPATGDPVDTVEQLVEVGDNRVGFWVADQKEVLSRFSGATIVSVRACSRRGKPDLDEPVWEGRAEVLTSGELFDAVKRQYAEKHEADSRMDGLIDRAKELFGKKTEEAVVVMTILA